MSRRKGAAPRSRAPRPVTSPDPGNPFGTALARKQERDRAEAIRKSGISRDASHGDLLSLAVRQQPDGSIRARKSDATNVIHEETMAVCAIPLTRGYVAIVDMADRDLVTSYKWYAKVYDDGRIYATAEINGRMTAMHTLLTGYSYVDHSDGECLNNRRSNLRQATKSQNAANQKLSSASASGYKGVSWRKDVRKWRAVIEVWQKQISLGCYNEPEDAARAYDHAAVTHFREFARTNVTLGLVSHDMCGDDCPCRNPGRTA